MRNIIHNLIFWRFKYIMHRNRSLYNTKVWSKMATMLTCSYQQCMTHFVCKYRQLLHIQFLNIRWIINCFNIHFLPLSLSFFSILLLKVYFKSILFLNFKACKLIKILSCQFLSTFHRSKRILSKHPHWHNPH